MNGIFSGIMLIMILVFYFFMGWVWWRIFRKTGYYGAFGILCLLPLVNIVMLLVLAFRRWPLEREFELREGKRIQAEGLPVWLIVIIVLATLVFIIAFLATIIIPTFLKTKLLANESLARQTVERIAKGVGAYVTVNDGRYPSDEKNLLDAQPPYLSQSYNNKEVEGYNYSLRFDKTGYEILAVPSECGITGNKIFIGDKEGKISEKDCR